MAVYEQSFPRNLCGFVVRGNLAFHPAWCDSSLGNGLHAGSLQDNWYCLLRPLCLSHSNSLLAFRREISAECDKADYESHVEWCSEHFHPSSLEHRLCHHLRSYSGRGFPLLAHRSPGWNCQEVQTRDSKLTVTMPLLILKNWATGMWRSAPTAECFTRSRRAILREKVLTVYRFAVSRCGCDVLVTVCLFCLGCIETAHCCTAWIESFFLAESPSCAGQCERNQAVCAAAGLLEF